MKNLLTALFCVFIFSTYAQDEFIEKVKKSRVELRKDITAKGLKYDGTKTTYFQFTDDTQYKGIEIAVFLRDNYHFFFDGSHSEGKVTIEIYDLSPDNPHRLKLYEIKNISGKKADVSMEEILKHYVTYGGDPETLSSLHIDYVIKKSKPSRGAITLSLGF
ncbi:hypothetical protein [Brumimicrobium sp.]|uniref:hypothetical protein n=1 Tax=Brumimicrobium sp. TaxID=2029867 RepID=UPI00260918AB|nr:hypothetical protein [uncultured Brumimicrobium sp.]